MLLEERSKVQLWSNSDETFANIAERRSCSNSWVDERDNSRTSSPPPPPRGTRTSSRPLAQHLPQQRIVSILVDMVNPHVALQIIGPRVLVPSACAWAAAIVACVWAEGAHIPGSIVGQAVADHLVLAFEALAAFAAGAAGDGAIVGSVWGVGCGVRAAEISVRLRLRIS